MPACNLSALVKKASSSACQSYIPAGVGDRVYLFDIDDMFRDGYPVPNDDGFVDAARINVSKLFALDIKVDSGQVTSEKGEDSQSRSLVFTGIVDHSIDKFLAIDGAIGNGMNVGVIVPVDNEKSYIIYSPYRSTKYASNYDSGTTYDSDHGFTITFTCSPVLFGCPMIKIGRGAFSAAQETYTPYMSPATVSPSMVMIAGTAKSESVSVTGGSVTITNVTSRNSAVATATYTGSNVTITSVAEGQTSVVITLSNGETREVAVFVAVTP